MSHNEQAGTNAASRRVVVTGAAGFKGRWLMDLLAQEGYTPIGWDIRHPEHPANYDWHQCDLTSPFEFPSNTDFVFHLAAQALVPIGYDDPRGTWIANVVATLNVLEALRISQHPMTAVIVTSDKVYRLPPQARPLHEDDELGGYCPYSSSKAACELVVQSYRSLLPAHVRVATVRAGNVIGGADSSSSRLVPDVISAARRGDPVELRNPTATRPWLFVLDCLWGYLSMARAMAEGSEPGTTMNFGPGAVGVLTAGEIAQLLSERLGAPAPILGEVASFNEAPYLQLATDRAQHRLGWQPALTVHEALEWTAEWAVAAIDDAAAGREVVSDQIARYLTLVRGS